MKDIEKFSKLDSVCYDIRGSVACEVKRLEEEGFKVMKLNTGNPAAFGFDAPDEITQDVIRHLPVSQGYSDSKGLFSARKAIMHYCQQKHFPKSVTIEDIYIGDDSPRTLPQQIPSVRLHLPLHVYNTRCIRASQLKMNNKANITVNSL